MAIRMRILAMEARIGKAVRDADEDLNGEPLERVRDAMEEHLHDWEEIRCATRQGQ